MAAKKISNPISTGGGGSHFESHVQASFVALMLTGGCAPCLPDWPIFEIKLQGKIAGYQTDDLIVSVKNDQTNEVAKLIGQIKRSVSIVSSDIAFQEVIQAAWADFNNPYIFNKGRDVIALISGPLSAVDLNDVGWLLHQAKHTKDADEFYLHVNQANFSPSKSQEKLKIIEGQLKIANGGQALTKDEVWSFLKCFYYLGYDLGNEYGVILSLLHSHLSQVSNIPKLIWTKIVDTVSSWNQNAGTLTVDGISDDIKDYFNQGKSAATTYSQPPGVIGFYNRSAHTSWRDSQHFSDISKLALIGSWDENNSFDRVFISKIIGDEYSNWISGFREILQYSDSPYSHKRGVWRLNDHTKTLEAIAATIFDDQLDCFLSNAADLLQSLKDQEPSGSGYSSTLAIGVSGGLAMLASSGELLTNCSRDRMDLKPALITRQVLSDLNVFRLSHVATIIASLAEVAPDEFMSAIERIEGACVNILEQEFSQENYDGVGLNSLLEILKALEILCWEERYLIRASELIACLAKYDSLPYGGNATRSLATIYLPWCPQTLAGYQKRISALNVLSKKFPEILWPILLDLLPNRQLSSSGTSKPKFRASSSLTGNNVFNQKEYELEISAISKNILEISFGEANKICDLIAALGSFPGDYFDQFIDYLSSPEIDGFSSGEKQRIWDALVSLLYKHRRFSEAGWSLPNESLDKVEGVVEKLTPIDPAEANRHYFNSLDFDLTPSSLSWSDQRESANQKRVIAIREIFDAGGISLVLDFVELVKFPGLVGTSFASLTKGTFDDELIPKYCDSTSKNIELFIKGYALERSRDSGIGWIDNFSLGAWTPQQVSSLLTHIPATIEIWTKAERLLGEHEGLYWQSKDFAPEITDKSLNFAIDKLVEYGNPNAAIECLIRLFYAKEYLDPNRCMNALNAASVIGRSGSTLDDYHVIELIKYLHKNSDNLNFDQICNIEWAYLSLLDGYHGAEPIFLQKKLSEDPVYFHSLLSLIYQSKNFDSGVHEVTEQERETANKAWSLFHAWKIPPGIEDGVFSGERFKTWLNIALQMSRDSGHFEVALLSVGQVLIYVPADQNGLFNKRGVHWVDPSGAPELALAEEYEKKANDVENAGFTKLGAALRNLSDSYGRDARVVINEYKDD